MTASDDAPVGGRLTATCHVLPVRVYFEDTDHSGGVYHANYLRFMERGRSEFIRALGISQTELARGALGKAMTFVVRRIAIDFHRPAMFDDLLDVETGVAQVTGVRFVLRQVIRRGVETLAEADVTVALVADGKPQRLPRDIVARLAALAPDLTAS